MSDTIRSLSSLQILLSELPNNISEDALRDVLVSVYSGFVSYDDQASKDTPIAGTADVELEVTIDRQGSNTNEIRAPFGVVLPMWNTTSNRFQFGGLETGDMVLGRFDFTITTSGNNADVAVVFELFNSSSVSQGQSTYKMPEIKQAGTHRMFMVLPIFIDSSIHDGDMAFKLLCSVNFTVSFGSMLAIIQR